MVSSLYYRLVGYDQCAKNLVLLQPVEIPFSITMDQVSPRTMCAGIGLTSHRPIWRLYRDLGLADPAARLAYGKNPSSAQGEARPGTTCIAR